MNTRTMTSMGNVVRSAMCATVHHELGWECERLRGHPGDHLSSDPYHDTSDPLKAARRVTWDTCGDVRKPYPGVPCILPRRHTGDHVHEDADGKGVSWHPDVTALPVLEDDGDGDGIMLEAIETRPGRYRDAFLAVLLALLVLCSPAIVAGAYRLGF